jgi:preprotein translocase subunit SecG
MIILITIIHVIVSLFLIGVVLLQSGKAADLAGAFGGLGSQTVFGPRGSATVLTRATAISAGVFMITSLSLSLLATNEGGGSGNSILDEITAPVQQTGEPTPEATPEAPAAPVPDNPVFPITPNGKSGETQDFPLIPTPAK